MVQQAYHHKYKVAMQTRVMKETSGDCERAPFLLLSRRALMFVAVADRDGLLAILNLP